jgi:hypothetical protein
MFYTYKHTRCILSSVQGLMMLVHIVENKEDGAGLDLADLVTKKVIKVRSRGCSCPFFAVCSLFIPRLAAGLLHVPR